MTIDHHRVTVSKHTKRKSFHGSFDLSKFEIYLNLNLKSLFLFWADNVMGIIFFLL